MIKEKEVRKFIKLISKRITYGKNIYLNQIYWLNLI